jgi:transcriptional regulator
MYIPAQFAETDLSRLHDFIEHHNFGVLLSVIQGEPFGTHLPFLLDREEGPFGTLLGHVARGNPHGAQLRDQHGMAILTGPHAYISPTWYEAENVVPTWNYTAVHAYGKIELIEEPESLLELLRRTVNFFEASMPTPWKLPEDSLFISRLLAQIVGFRLRIERLEGKMKLNQNHPEERRQKVATALNAIGDENSLGIAALMREVG